MGANKVRDLFRQANEKAPCIVFIDEIDTIGKKRGGAGSGSNDGRMKVSRKLRTGFISLGLTSANRHPLSQSRLTSSGSLKADVA